MDNKKAEKLTKLQEMAQRRTKELMAPRNGQDFWRSVLGIMTSIGEVTLPTFSNVLSATMNFGAKLSLEYKHGSNNRLLEMDLSCSGETVHLMIKDTNISAGKDVYGNWKQHRLVFSGFCTVPYRNHTYKLLQDFPVGIACGSGEDFRTITFRNGKWRTFFDNVAPYNVNEEVFRADPKLTPLFDTILDRQIARAAEALQIIERNLEAAELM